MLKSVISLRQEINRNIAQVIVRENESLESALKRFKRSCARDGVMAEVRKEGTLRKTKRKEKEEIRSRKEKG